MTVAFAMFDPAIRVVNASGAVVKQAVRLGVNKFDSTRGAALVTGSPSHGLHLLSSRCSYANEVIGPENYADYSRGPSLLGFRPKVDLDFDLIEMSNEEHAPPGYGFRMLLSYFVHATAVSAPTFAPLQFNLFYDNEAGSPAFPDESPWRGMFVSSDWDPEPAAKKQTSPGAAWTMSLYAKDLIAAPGDWSARTW